MVKIVGNFLLISATSSLTEALRLIDVTGGDMQAVVHMLTQTLFPSPIYQSYGSRIAERQPTFSQSNIPSKDLGLFEAIAQQHQVTAPIAQAIRSLLQSRTSP